MAQVWGTIAVVGTPNPKIGSGSGFTILREKITNIKKPVLVCLVAFLALSSISRTAAAQGDWVPNCAPGFSVMKGEKTVNLTNNSPNPEVLVVDLVSANWDATVKNWLSGKTYTLKLPADPGKTVSGHLSYVGCGKVPFDAVAFQIAIVGASNWVYELTNNDPYAPGQQGNLNSIINVISTVFDKYIWSFSNVGGKTGVPLTPKLATASSTNREGAPVDYYRPANAMNPDKAAWMSSVSTGKPEWLQYDYGAGVKVKVSAVRAYLTYGRSASTFQGSNDGATWVTFGSWYEGKMTDHGAPSGEASYADGFSASPEGYRYIRIYSPPTPYLYYSWLQFYGVVVQ
jgi:hypothetical protein